MLRQSFQPAFAPPAMLASVMSPHEATLALAGGADIIDAKNPLAGAYGALPRAVVHAIRDATPRGVRVSATVGDGTHDELVEAVRLMANETGCTFVKVAFARGSDSATLITALGRLDLGSTQLVGMLLADQAPDFSMIDAMAKAGFAGALLDTADKATGTLLDACDEATLAHFIARTQNLGLFAGLAGALRISHVPTLMRLKPNVIGFRGALCVGSNRKGTLTTEAVLAVRAQLDGAGTIRHVARG
jgi:(5-formylfuran-3-yl)methyl phosphate synthase